MQKFAMKNVFTFLFITLAFAATAQKHKLVKLWETDTVIAVPESVLPVGNTLYVSLIDGQPWDVDGKGGIAKVQTNGKVISPYWVHGLNAPKGMAKVGNRLYVADISEVAVIDLTSGKIVKKIKLEGAEGLNDVTATSAGVVFVSDSKKATVWRIEKDQPALYLEKLEGVNGLKAVKDELYIASGKSFVKADMKKKVVPVATLPEGGDGVEPVGNGDFIATAWGGWIYYVSADGKIETMLDTSPQKKNTADIGYDPLKKIVYVPTFFGKTVAAYSLQ
jgi:DNA-binding beta-propeller fold protein YncE